MSSSGNTLETVSYTHLDVYKRQPDCIAPWIPASVGPTYSLGTDPPVSYTHLDVYKRQAPIRVSAGFLVTGL